MNVTNLKSVIIPKTKYNIIWDGFVYDTNVYLEEKKNGVWKESFSLIKNTLAHNYLGSPRNQNNKSFSNKGIRNIYWNC